ncbi:MAG: hypothetical protein K2J16_05870 [Clostridia bacterium]|nr:hypothetical protein [Clostridia bacterium]
MKKLVTALIVVLPLILLVALFAITGIARISADIPVTGIIITNKGNDGVFVFDLADYSSPLYESDLGVEVQPLVAKNREYTLSITDTDGNESSDIVTRDRDGAFRLHGVGQAKLTYTSRDGNHSDSVMFNVTASGATNFTPVISDKTGNTFGLSVGTETDYAVTLSSGRYMMSGSYFPSTIFTAHATYECNNSTILDFNGSNGTFIARFGGTAVVTMSVQSTTSILKKTIAVTVLPSGAVTIDGSDATSQARIPSSLRKNSVTFSVQSAKAIDQNDIIVSALSGLSSFSVSKAEGADNAFFITMYLSQAYAEPTSVPYTLYVGGEQYQFFVDYADFNVSIFSPTSSSGRGDIYAAADSTIRLVASIEPYDARVLYAWSVDDNSIFTVSSASGDACFIKAVGVGETTLSLSWTSFDGEGNITATGVEERTLISIQGYTSLLFAENADTYGMGNLAVASHRYENGMFEKNTYISKFRAYDKSGNTVAIENIDFFSSDESLATVYCDQNAVYITAHGTGIVTVTAIWKYGYLFGTNNATFTFTAVDGVLTSSDEGLRAAYKINRAVVLEKDIYLGEQLFDVSSNGTRMQKYSDEIMREKLLAYTDEINTTADWTYYKNLGYSQPTVRYCLDITADLYGNGHTVNAEYITNTLDATDKPYEFSVFNGPLDFVATSSGGIKLAAVKAQDNIVFLVRTDGVTIDNAVLKGCDDQTLYDDGSINLSLLNNMGTTLEIMSDATVKNSRVMNGRTVLRAFGRYGVADDSEVDVWAEKINVTVDNCILQNAREFILKTGTNRALRGTLETPEPSLLDASGNEYADYNSSACDDYINDEFFTTNYILTEITLKDSTLRTSGLFAVGVESHFAGPMLAGDEIFHLDGWQNLAATSYPALLRLVGKVVLADWKTVSSIDSSTLIESDASRDSLAFLSLNIAEMLKAVQEFGGEDYKNLIATDGNNSYAHGGIAFYGGGKNYSILDTSEYTFEKMNEYVVNLTILKNSQDSNLKQQGTLLPLAAGMESFRFVMFDATSEYSHNS